MPKARRIILILLLLLLCLLLLLVGWTGLFFWRISHGPRPFSEIIRPESVEKITLQYSNYPDEYPLDPESSDGAYGKAIELVQNLRFSLPRMDKTLIFGGFSADLHFYLKNGEKHTLSLRPAGTVGYLWGIEALEYPKNHAYAAMNTGKQYIIPASLYDAFRDLLKPYTKIIAEMY